MIDTHKKNDVRHVSKYNIFFEVV